jgi:hypothetical protein
MKKQKIFCLVRMSDSYILKQMYTSQIEAVLHKNHLTMVTGYEYHVLRYIGPITISE